MENTKSYLNVPYAEKDAAKALGAKWDPAKKKWYVPKNIDFTPFLNWQSAELPKENESRTHKYSINTSSSSKSGTLGTMTYPVDKNFVAYSGVEPPWDE